MPELNTKLIEACQRYINDPTEEREQAIRDLLLRWIPCSERLPDQNGKHLVVGRQKAINILKFDGGRWYGKWGVVAWMPLPKPYEEDDDG